MPEGPEIRQAADTIARVLEGQIALRVFFAFEHLKSYGSILTGQRIQAVQARGKAMLIHFQDLSIYSHNQLYGRWVTTRQDQPPTTRRQIRLSLASPRGASWLLSASDIEVLDEEGRLKHPYLSKLGPDPLEPSTTEKTLLQHWGNTRRSLAALFLDQSFLAGVGNYLRSEILFEAGLHPAGTLPKDRRKLARAALEICRRSYQLKGVTNDPELARRLQREGWKRKDYRHWVFNRAQQPCHRCGSTIEKEILAGRRIYFCPECQPQSDPLS